MADAAIIREWLNKAEEDLRFAEANLLEGNEFFAQICFHELRLNTLGVERDVAMMNKEIQKIKATIRHKGTSKKVAAHVSKGHRHQARKG